MTARNSWQKLLVPADAKASKIWERKSQCNMCAMASLAPLSTGAVLASSLVAWLCTSGFGGGGGGASGFTTCVQSS